MFTVLTSFFMYFLSRLSDVASLLSAGEVVDSNQVPVQGLSAEAYERRISRLESEKSELSRKLIGMFDCLIV